MVDYKDNKKNDVDDLVGYKVCHRLCLKGFFCLFSLASDVLTPVLRHSFFYTEYELNEIVRINGKMIMITSGQHFLTKGFFSQIKLVCFVFPFRTRGLDWGNKTYKL